MSTDKIQRVKLGTLQGLEVRALRGYQQRRLWRRVKRNTVGVVSWKPKEGAIFRRNEWSTVSKAEMRQ